MGEIALGYEPTTCGAIEPIKNGQGSVRCLDPEKRKQKILETVQLEKEKLTADEYKKFSDLIGEYHSVFRLQGDPHGHCNYVQHRIQLSDPKPVNRGPYRCAQTEKDELKRQIDEMRSQGETNFVFVLLMYQLALLW